MIEAFFPSAREYAALYGLSAARADRLRPDALVMHPGPMNRGLEIAGSVADSPRSTVLEQVENGIAVRMAVLYDVLAGERTA
jgi:aspartate carbamoyltransferase catalytic subunit